MGLQNLQNNKNTGFEKTLQNKVETKQKQKVSQMNEHSELFIAEKAKNCGCKLLILIRLSVTNSIKMDKSH